MDKTLRSILNECAVSNGINEVRATFFFKEVVSCIKLSLLGGCRSITLDDFGTFNIVHSTAKDFVDRQTGKEVSVPEHDMVRFYPVKELNFIKVKE